jgi:hypothetical protein
VTDLPVPTIVVVSGSRSITPTRLNVAIVQALLVGLNDAVRSWDSHTPFEIVHGDARGLDALVHEVYELLWADDPMVVEHRHPADWPSCAHDCPPTSSHRRTRSVPDGQGGLVDETYCPAAGVRRNGEMLDQRKPHLGLAFVDKPQHLSRGTDDMITRLKAARIPHAVTNLGGTHR